jgi:hypothetical protein
VVVTLQGEELFLDGLIEPYRTRARELIRQQVVHVDRFIAVSEYCAAFMPGFIGFPRDRVDVVPLGVNPDGHEMREPSGVFTVGYFARIAAEKGLHVLAEAYVRFRRRIGGAPARLTAAGYLSAADHPYLERVKGTRSGGPGRTVRLSRRGGRPARWRSERPDAPSVPVIYDEPKGLFVRGNGQRRVCGAARGAFTEMVERTGGGLFRRCRQPGPADGLRA